MKNKLPAIHPREFFAEFLAEIGVWHAAFAPLQWACPRCEYPMSSPADSWRCDPAKRSARRRNVGCRQPIDLATAL
jgi:hypothetical protein